MRAASSPMATQLSPSLAGKRIAARLLMPPLIKRPRLRASAISPNDISPENACGWVLVPRRGRWRCETEEFLAHGGHDENLGLFRQGLAREDDMRVLGVFHRKMVMHAVE